jgi:hypothetical protein
VSEGLQNFSTVITTLAAVGAVYVAWMGLRTWKAQIEWEQGRGLAKALLVSANKIRTLARAVRSEFFFQHNQTAGSSDQEKRHKDLTSRVLDYVAEFDEAVDDFERHTVEAKLLWRASFDEPLSEFRDIAHTVRSYLYSGLGSASPLASEQERQQMASAHAAFHPEIFYRDNIYKKLNVAIEKVETITTDKMPR